MGKSLAPRFSAWRPHPWHGLSSGREPPTFVDAYVEITPLDVVKYEVDKVSGYVRVDRPLRGSSHPPALYGFIPRTYCGSRVAALGPRSLRGDGDPLDVCVLSERPIGRAEILVPARVVGGLAMLDKGEADDKIIAVLEGDLAWGAAQDLSDLPPIAIERLRHYFTTYKLTPDAANPIEIRSTYDAAHARQVVDAALADYRELVGE